MRVVRTVHTGDLDAATREAARGVLREVFDDLTEADWEHCLGGVHALAYDGERVVGHASLVQRRLLHAGRALRAGYVEGVGVLADHRGRGHGAAMMAELERLARGAYEIAALGATDEAAAFYAARGWLLWRGLSSALTPHGVRPTPQEDGCLYVLPLAAALDLDAPLTCDWRDGDAW